MFRRSGTIVSASYSYYTNSTVLCIPTSQRVFGRRKVEIVGSQYLQQLCVTHARPVRTYGAERQQQRELFGECLSDSCFGFY